MTFDDETLVANAGLVLPATLMARFGLEALVNATVRLSGRVGGARPGRKVLSLVATILAGGSHIDHADMLRAGATQAVLPFRVMAPSSLGTFLAVVHVRSCPPARSGDRRDDASGMVGGAGPGGSMTIDMDSTICEVHGKQKHGAAFGYTRVLGYDPLLATRADTGEVLHARLRKGSSQWGTNRFIEELIARVRRAGATGPLTLRADSGFWSYQLIDTLDRLRVDWSITVNQNAQIKACIALIAPDAWTPIDYTAGGEARGRGHDVCDRAGFEPTRVPTRCAPQSPHRPRPSTALAGLALSRVHHQPRHRRRRRGPVPPRPRESRTRDPRPQRRCRARTLPVRQVLRYQAGS